jgi:hypothetical protein
MLAVRSFEGMECGDYQFNETAFGSQSRVGPRQILKSLYRPEFRGLWISMLKHNKMCTIFLVKLERR